jgi:hypothetical protein
MPATNARNFAYLTHLLGTSLAPREQQKPLLVLHRNRHQAIGLSVVRQWRENDFGFVVEGFAKPHS